jgi:hypothetical protein
MASITGATLTLRSTKGSPLTNAEVDANFTNLNTALQTGQTSASYTAADVLAKLITVDGTGSGLDADLLDGLNSATANTASTIVARDSSGNFAAGTITATLSGNASTATALTATLGVSAGGTGAITAAAARTNLGVVIGTDVQAYNANLNAFAGLTGAADNIAYWSGATTLANTAFTATGRSIVGAASTGAIRTTLGLVVGTDVQAYNANLTAISGIATTGIYVRTAAGTAAVRTLVAGTNLSITNADGVSGNITIDATTQAPVAGTGVTVVGTTVSIGQAVATTSNVQFNSLGVGTAGSTTAGEIRATNQITAYYSSDKNLKENITDIPDALAKVNHIGGKLYDWTDEYISNHGGEDGYFVQKSDFGVIAQDVQEVFPVAVRSREDGTLAVDYQKLCALAFAAIKELNREVELLKNKG